MEPLYLPGDDGATHTVHFTSERLEPFGYEYQSRVSTVKGNGSVVGVGDSSLYVVLDVNQTAGLVTAFALSNISEEVEPLTGSDAALDPDALLQHRVKLVCFRGRRVRIVMQSREGPCPVIALANALALKDMLDVSPRDDRFVSARELRERLAAYLRTAPLAPMFRPTTPMVRTPPALDPDVPPPGEQPTLAGIAQSSTQLEEVRLRCIGQSAEDRMAEKMLRKLYDGMNIDPVFDGVESFAGDDDVTLFALGGVRVLHGWVIAAGSYFEPLQELTFNELGVVAAMSPFSPRRVHPLHNGVPAMNGNGVAPGDEQRHVLAKEFYDSTISSQMTAEGLLALRESIEECEVVVLFWRNHFFTATKLNGRLLTLCSDESFTDKSSFVFTVMRNEYGDDDGFADGDGLDVDASVSYIQALHGSEFAESEILAAKAALQRSAMELGASPEEAEHVSPVEVLAYLQNAAAAAAAAKQRRGKGSRRGSTAPVPSPNPPPTITADTTAATTTEGTADITRRIQQFREVFPDTSDEVARTFLSRHNSSLDRAIDDYCQNSGAQQ